MAVSNVDCERPPTPNPGKRVVTETVPSNFESEQTPKMSKMRVLITFGSLGMIHLYIVLPMFSFSLYLPQWADDRGISGTWVGIITGITFFSGAVAGIVNTQINGKINTTNSIVIGTLITGCFTILFGFTERLENKEVFLALAFIIRTGLGYGIVMADSNVYASINKYAPPEHLALIIGITDMLGEIAMASSPLIGGLLYEAGGYIMPFVVLGPISILCAVATLMAAPPSSTEQLPDSSGDKDSFSDLVKSYTNRNMISYSISFMIIGSCMSFLNGMIQPHLEQFHLSTAEMGLLVLVPCFSSSLTFPIWGIISDKLVHVERLSMFGNLLLAIGYMLFGPFPGFNYKNEVWIMVVAMSICGVGMSSVLTSMYLQGYRYLRKNCKNERLGDAVMSSCYISMYCFGSFFGAMLGGVFIDFVGYRWGSLILALIQIANLLMQVVLQYFPDKSAVLE